MGWNCCRRFKIKLGIQLRILLSHRFFWPDSAPYAALLRAVGRHFAATGNSVTVISAQPTYQPSLTYAKQPAREILDGMTVHRIALLKEYKKDFLVRGCNSVIYSIRLFLHILCSKKYDLVVAATFPPVLAAFLACLASRIRGSRFIYHCQDIHPEVSITIGSGRSRFWSAIGWIDKWTCNNATAVIVLSSDMKQTLVERSLDLNARIEIINNFDQPDYRANKKGDDEIGPLGFDGRSNRSGTEFQVIFTGNLGRFQNLEAVIHAANSLKDLPQIEFVFVGEGSSKQRLRELATDLRCESVKFIPYQNISATKALINQADFGLVALQAGMHKVAYPSKTMTYLVVGCPIIALVDPTSELARSVVSDRLGLVVEHPTSEALADTVRMAYQHRAYWRQARSRVRDYAKKHYSESETLDRWHQLLDSIQYRD